MKRLGAYFDPRSMFMTEVWWDPQTNTQHYRRVQRTDKFYKVNQEIREGQPHSHLRNDGLYRAARIPYAEIEKLMTKGINWFKLSGAEQAKLINKNPHWKTVKGTV